MNFKNLNMCNSFSDKPAILINNNVCTLNEDNLNVDSVNKEGIYVFNGDYSSSVTPLIVRLTLPLSSILITLTTTSSPIFTCGSIVSILSWQI